MKLNKRHQSDPLLPTSSLLRAISMFTRLIYTSIILLTCPYDGILQAANGLATKNYGTLNNYHHCRPYPIAFPASNVFDPVDSSRRSVLANLLSLPILLKPYISFAGEEFDYIDWLKSKSRGLNVEQMADGINDSIRESSWLVSGSGRPEYFSDYFVYSSGDKTAANEIRGYENYCRKIRELYNNSNASCDLICCSVTNPNTITALWRFSVEKNGINTSKVISTTFVTNIKDGLVLAQRDKTIMDENAPSSNELRAKCNWYSCTLTGI